MAEPVFDPSKPFKKLDQRPEPEFDFDKPYLSADDDAITPPELPEELQEKEGKGFFTSLMQALDRFTGAEPTREFLTGVAEEGVVRGLERGIGVFGKPLGEGVTGKEAARTILPELGMDPDEPIEAGTVQAVGGPFGIVTPTQREKSKITRADVLGTFLDVFATPALVTKPVGLGLKAGKEVTKKAGDIALTGLGKVPTVGRPAEVGIRAGIGSIRDKVAVAADFPKLLEIQKKFDIRGEPTLELEFGIDTSLGRAGQRRRLANEMGEADKFKQLAQQTEDAIERQITTIGGALEPLSPTEAGEAIMDAFNNAKNQVFERASVTFSSMDEFPELAISGAARDKLLKALKPFEKEAAKDIALDLSDTLTKEAKDLLKKIAATKEVTGSFEDTVYVWRKIGQEAFAKPRPGVQIQPTNQKALQKLYFEINDALLDTVRTDVPGGEQIAAEIVENNAILSKFFKQGAKLEKAIGNKESGEQVFKAIALGNTAVAREARELLGEVSPDTIDIIKGALVKSFKKEKFVSPESPSFVMFGNAIQNNSQKIANWLRPDEIEDLRDLVEFSMRIGSRQAAPGLGRSGFFNKNAFLRAMDSAIVEAAAEAKAAKARRAIPTAPPRLHKRALKEARRRGLGAARAAEIQARDDDLDIRLDERPFITPPQR